MPFFYKIGGVEKVIMQRLLFLQDYFEILVFESNADKIAAKKENFRFNVYSINYKKKAIIPIFNYIKIYKKLLNDFKPDEVIVVDNGWKSLLIPFFVKHNTTIYERHGAIHFNKTHAGLFYTLKRKIFHLLSLKYDKVIFLNEAMSDDWTHPNKIVMPNGIFLNQIKSNEYYPNVVIWVGRISPEKGLDHLLKIWEKASKSNPNWSLKIFTPEKLDLVGLSAYSNIENIVGIADKSLIYQSGSILVNTSNYEGFGLTILEGMNFGLPVMAFDVPDGPKYLIENNENGFLIQPFNLEYFSEKLIELMNDEQLRQNFGQKSYEKSLNFDLNKIHEKWLEIYKS